MLTLNEQGNGPYAWKDGRIETQMLFGQTWQGMWFQKDNDREGGFMVEFLPNFQKETAYGGTRASAAITLRLKKAVPFISSENLYLRQ